MGTIFRDVEDVRIPNIAKFLERRNVMNVGVVTPLLLWLLDADLPPARLSRCLTALESFLVRRVVCGYSARSYGDLFVGLIRNLSDTETQGADEVVVSYLGGQTAQSGLWPGDEEMRQRFVTAPLYWYLTRGRLRMVLEGVEEALRTKKGGTRDRIVHTIGNLTLVNDRLNPALSNAPWDTKRESLANHSILFLNKHLVNKSPNVWDETAIEERANWLHKRVVTVWPNADNVPFG